MKSFPMQQNNTNAPSLHIVGCGCMQFISHWVGPKSWDNYFETAPQLSPSALGPIKGKGRGGGNYETGLYQTSA
jgi:hypothetical protein